MNFLAHQYLSGSNVSFQIGNFIADFVKGNQGQQFNEEIQQGIKIHRAIDEFTDSHAIVQLSKAKLRPKYRHYSGVLVDIFYDHFLASGWSIYSDIPLERFAQQVYDTMNSHLPLLPERVQQMLPFMIQHNWLANYAHLEGIQQVLNGMSRRTLFESKMEQAVTDLQVHYSEFQSEFTAFFPELQQHILNEYGPLFQKRS